MGRGPRRHYVARVDDAEPRHACHPRLARRTVSRRRSGVLLLTRTLDLTPAEGIILAHGRPVQTCLGRQAVTAEVRSCGCPQPRLHSCGGIAFQRHPWCRRGHYRLTVILPGAGVPLDDRCHRSRAAVMSALQGEVYGPSLWPELLVKGAVQVGHYRQRLRADEAGRLPSAYFLRWCREARHTWH